MLNADFRGTHKLDVTFESTHYKKGQEEERMNRELKSKEIQVRYSKQFLAHSRCTKYVCK